ncbi:MAG: ATP synthase F1 subunit epsilon [Sandaracinaceae bacterium]
MSDQLLTLEVATPLGLALHTECESIAAPSVEGEFGVLPGHLPLLAALRAGIIKYRVSGEDLAAAVGPGFVEAGPEKVLLLTDLFVRPEDVDADSVREELEVAEKRLAEHEGVYAGHDYEEIVRSIEWAHARLELLGAANES